MHELVGRCGSDPQKQIALMAPDARSAIGRLESTQHIDLMISDVVLPHINGRKLAETARGFRPHLPVLFVSDYAENALGRGELLDAGRAALAKPFSLSALGAKVHDMIKTEYSDA